MSGIYIHIPFCKKKCNYCDFYSESIIIDNGLLMETYINTLIKEIELRRNELNSEEIKTIFIGGGTPNILPERLLRKLLKYLGNIINIDNIVEYTIENNPEFVTPTLLELLSNYGINRVSVGIQSFNNKHLSKIGRISNQKTNIHAIENIKQSKIHSFNCDMIFGIPEQTTNDIYNDIIMLKSYVPDHISYYGLTLEDGTLLHKMVVENKIKMINDDMFSDMYKFIMKSLEEVGYNMYEVSNYSKNNMESLHNINYWKGGKYYGFGASATSFDGTKRYKNYPNINKYINAVENKGNYEYIEVINNEQKIIETIMLSLRMVEGLDLNYFFNKFDIDLKKLLYTNNNLLKLGLVSINENRLSVTKEGFLVFDSIIAEIINNCL